MPLSSADIAGSIGQFQGMYAQQAGYSSMISGMANLQGPPQVQAEQAAGGMMNRVGAMAGPAAGLALGMAGLDPLSLGLKAGLGAWGAGAGVGGAALAGAGVAGAAAIPMAVASYVGNQMMTGAQQQQQFNQNMRQSFYFQTGTGSGFNNAQLGMIGGGLRGMSNQTGPGGELTSFGELSQLASNMGKMGLATGVRDVQQFKQRFQEMVSTLKIVAREMGTSLEAAQEFMVNMKSSGIFRTSDQLKMASQMRGFAVAGNLATSELAGMANIGAQISRSIGGRGRAGAFGGMKTLGDIGTSTQMGIINEEDIYNATGLTGAEGRQALATRQMSQAASFLQGGRGRRFLASIAGANGELDEGSVSQWMAGGMGTGRTMQNAYGNLNKVGRAGFIRNEGKLRGAALQQFGGLIPAMSLMQWAGDRGVDIESMGDREMLFASRQLGMGMDELEVAVKQARDMPSIIRQQQESRRSDQYLQRQSERRKTQGFEGVKRNFDHLGQKINNELQQSGAEILNMGTNMVERFFNSISGAYYEHVTNEARQAFRAAMEGGGTKGMEGTLLSGGRMNPMFAKGAGQLGGGGGAFTGGMQGTSRTAAFMGENQSWLGRAMGLKSDVDKYREAGFGALFKGNLSGFGADTAGRDRALDDRLKAVREFQASADQLPSNTVLTLGHNLRNELNAAYVDKGFAGLKGQDRVDAVSKWLGDRAASDPEAAKAYAALQEAKKTGQAPGIIQGLELGAGVDKAALLSRVSTTEGMTSPARGFATQADRYEARGQGLTGRTSSYGGAVAEIGAGIVGITTAAGWGLIGRGVSDIIGQRGVQNQNIALGEFMESDKGQQLSRALISGSAADVDIKQKEIQSHMQMLLASGKGGSQEFKGYQTLSAMAAASAQAWKTGKQLTQQEINAIAKEKGVDAGQLAASLQETGKYVTAQQQENRDALAREQSEIFGGEAKALRSSGAAVVGDHGLVLSADNAAALDKATPGGAAMVSAYLAKVSAGENLTGSEASFGRLRDAQDNLDNLMRGKSASQLRAIAKTARDQGNDPAANIFEFQASFNDKYQNLKRRGRGSDANAVSKMLGADISMRDIMGKQNTIGGGQALARQTLEKLGISGASAGLQEELTALYSGQDIGKGIDGSNLRLTQQQRQERLQQLTTGSGTLATELRDRKKEAREGEQREKDPLMAKVADALEKIVDNTNDIGPSKVALGQLVANTGDIKTNTAKGEKPTVGGGDKPH